ncbi:hypothetical protein EVAR_78541_1 [Eumeta japonica]|uniref:Uncharacterized protein n=1 Tax=Eumeta variegata TaxID=151549 RepID=A0A4C1W6Z6_EUMVA|nr:hypothetical protein EVAR_78541_1 [Eumeta japonica]
MPVSGTRITRTLRKRHVTKLKVHQFFTIKYYANKQNHTCINCTKYNFHLKITFALSFSSPVGKERISKSPVIGPILTVDKTPGCKTRTSILRDGAVRADTTAAPGRTALMSPSDAPSECLN